MLSKIAAIARNTLGYSSHARDIMLKGTIGAYMMYASSSWAYALSKNKNALIIDQIHRRMC